MDDRSRRQGLRVPLLAVRALAFAVPMLRWPVKAMVDKKRRVKALSANAQKAREALAQRKAAEAEAQAQAVAAEAEAQAQADACAYEAHLYRLQADLQQREQQLADNQRLNSSEMNIKRKEQQEAELVAQQLAALQQREQQVAEQQHQLQQQQTDLQQREQQVAEQQHQLQQQQTDLQQREQQVAEQQHQLQQQQTDLFLICIVDVVPFRFAA
ncbi:hypothetical protein QJQ45_000019 [Haematococcus lacustris]|nr:hypothetical protein QJQ45_000019 [Haematococcus lacustris]